MLVHILAACAKKKVDLPTAGLAMRELLPETPDVLATEWLERASAIKVRYDANQLYRSPAWNYVLQARAALNSVSAAKLTIMSAGFGLVDEADTLPPYSASFSPGPDCVAEHIIGDITETPAQRHKEWWRIINHHRTGTITPIADLSQRLVAETVYVVVGGFDYISAVEPDLVQLIDTCGNDHVIIISAGTKPGVVDAKLRSSLIYVGGGRLPLTANQQLLAVISRQIEDSAQLTPAGFQQLSGWTPPEHPAPIVPMRGPRKATARTPREDSPRGRQLRCDDNMIREFVQGYLAQGNKPVMTKVLRAFRDTGNSCAQDRMAQIIQDVLVAESTQDATAADTSAAVT
jgi:hypothetical protein